MGEQIGDPIPERDRPEFIITPSDTIAGVFFTNDWGDPSGEPWKPNEGKIWVPQNEVCPDCKGKGVIELFTSSERCHCQNE